jgi:ElaB/YqjD/DUF883 family membrane-anchored ribosome-binding protein
VKNDVSALTDQITDAINAFTGQAGKEARRGAKQARSRADDLMSDLQDRGSSVYDDLRDRGSSMYDDLRERGSAAYDAAASMEESLEDVITHRPIASVGLALGLGLLIGMAWRR